MVFWWNKYELRVEREPCSNLGVEGTGVYGAGGKVCVSGKAQVCGGEQVYVCVCAHMCVCACVCLCVCVYLHMFSQVAAGCVLE